GVFRYRDSSEEPRHAATRLFICDVRPAQPRLKELLYRAFSSIREAAVRPNPNSCGSLPDGRPVIVTPRLWSVIVTAIFWPEIAAHPSARTVARCNTNRDRSHPRLSLSLKQRSTQRYR